MVDSRVKEDDELGYKDHNNGKGTKEEITLKDTGQDKEAGVWKKKNEELIEEVAELKEIHIKILREKDRLMEGLRNEAK